MLNNKVLVVEDEEILAKNLEIYLEAQGLDKRQAVLEDRRAKKIVLCPPAKPLIDQIETIANQLRVELFTGVDEADLQTCMRVHAKILANLEKS